MNDFPVQESFDFRGCVESIKKSVSFLRANAKDLIIEMSESDLKGSTIRVRIESRKYIGEIVVWSSGLYSQTVIDVASEKYYKEEPDNKLTGVGMDRTSNFFSYYKESSTS